METTPQRRENHPASFGGERVDLERDFDGEFDSIRRSNVMVDAQNLLSTERSYKHSISPNNNISSSNITEKLPLIRNAGNIPRTVNTLPSSPLKLPRLIRMEPTKKLPALIPMNKNSSLKVPLIPISKEKKTVLPKLIPINKSSSAKKSLPIIPVSKTVKQPTTKDVSQPISEIVKSISKPTPASRIPINQTEKLSQLVPNLITNSQTQSSIPSNKRKQSLETAQKKKAKIDESKLIFIPDTEEEEEDDEEDDFYDATDQLSEEYLNHISNNTKEEDEIEFAQISKNPKIRKVNLDGELELQETTQPNESKENNKDNDNNNENMEEEEEDNDKSNNENKFNVSESEISNVKSKLYEKLTGFSKEGPYGLDSKIEEIYKLLEETVINKGKNSCFIFGPRSCGKSSSLNKAIDQIKMKTDNKELIEIKLNGNIQDDDKLAVRSIAEQLDSEISRIYGINLNDLEASEFLSRKSLTATMSNILKILDTEVSLKDGTVSKFDIPIIFIIEDAEIYAQQGRQTLLYNLFDLVENSKTPISVLCFTTRLTLKDLLEKRVRSRFSQKSIQFQKFTRDEFLEICEKILKIDKPSSKYEILFNSKVENLIKESSNLRKLIIFNHLTVANLKDFQNNCIYAVSQLSKTEPFFNDLNFAKYNKNVSKGSLRTIINSLSDLEIYLLVSAARVLIKNDLSWCNLNLVYQEYENQVKLKSKETSSTGGIDAVTTTGYKVWSKDSCKHPWEILQNIGLLTKPVNLNTSKSREFSNNSFETKMWHVELTLEELRLVIENDKPAKSWTRL